MTLVTDAPTPAKKATKRAPAKKAAAKKPAQKRSPGRPRTGLTWHPVTNTAHGGVISKIGQESLDRPGVSVAESAVMNIAAGDPVQVAVTKAGIHPFTFTVWMKRGDKERVRMWTADVEEPAEDEMPYVRFVCWVEQAKAHAESKCAEVWRASKNWQARQAYGRQFYGWANETQRLELTGADGGPVQVARIPTLAEMELLVAMEEARAAELQRRTAIDAESRELLEG